MRKPVMVYYLPQPIKVSSVQSVSMSPHEDTFVVVHMAAPERDLLINLNVDKHNKVWHWGSGGGLLSVRGCSFTMARNGGALAFDTIMKTCVVFILGFVPACMTFSFSDSIFAHFTRRWRSSSPCCTSRTSSSTASPCPSTLSRASPSTSREKVLSVSLHWISFVLHGNQ